ncbi:MAG: hypothetical protein MUE99_07705 [Chitinophagaceae bacterium]|nr:hypothetical protein [Chitinophagaceae bacterium]
MGKSEWSGAEMNNTLSVQMNIKNTFKQMSSPKPEDGLNNFKSHYRFINNPNTSPVGIKCNSYMKSLHADNKKAIPAGWLKLILES